MTDVWGKKKKKTKQTIGIRKTTTTAKTKQSERFRYTTHLNESWRDLNQPKAKPFHSCHVLLLQ